MVRIGQHMGLTPIEGRTVAIGILLIAGRQTASRIAGGSAMLIAASAFAAAAVRYINARIDFAAGRVVAVTISKVLKTLKECAAALGAGLTTIGQLTPFSTLVTLNNRFRPIF